MKYRYIALILVILIVIPLVLSGDFSLKQDRLCWKFNDGGLFCIGSETIFTPINFSSDVVFESDVTMNNLTVNGTLLSTDTIYVSNITDTSHVSWLTINNTEVVICGGC